MEFFKYYVDVVTLVNQDGTVQPLFVRWQDHTYKVDQILSCQEKFSLAGGCGLCFRCRFGQHIRNLFYEKDRWFLETTVRVNI